MRHSCNCIQPLTRCWKLFSEIFVIAKLIYLKKTIMYIIISQLWNICSHGMKVICMQHTLMSEGTTLETCYCGSRYPRLCSKKSGCSPKQWYNDTDALLSEMMWFIGFNAVFVDSVFSVPLIGCPDMSLISW